MKEEDRGAGESDAVRRSLVPEMKEGAMPRNVITLWKLNMEIASRSSSPVEPSEGM